MSKSATEIRQEFLEFFRQRGHRIVDSTPVVPHDDPTLLFTNAGMNQFKDIFLGTGKPPKERRAADTQKCIRAGGKHNDLDDVGRDTYHHTFFEMLGNWSFGDYFKKEAIAWAWELLTDVWGLDKARLHATYFEGDETEHLEPDNEARDLWATVTDIAPAHIHPGGKKDNFWEMGETGPCGPCSEIHIDLTPDKSGAALVNTGDARVIEIWNLVFIQFNRAPDGTLAPLPAKHVDTGMGFERVCAVLQGKTSNYDTDVFTPIFAAIRDVTGAPPYAGTLPSGGGQGAGIREQGAGSGDQSAAAVGAEPDPRSPIADPQSMLDVSYRVIADHVRCLTFAITDGCLPDRDGRGFVLRRILRRAVRYGWQYMNMHEPFLYKLVPAIGDVMGDVFPELHNGPDARHPRDNVKHVADLIREEEESFDRTLGRGIALFEEAVERAVQSRDHTAPSRARKEAVASTDATNTSDRIPLAYFITYHTYGTWLHGTERGSVDRRRNIPGTSTLETNEQREDSECERLKHAPISLDARMRAVVEQTLHEVAAHRGWEIHMLRVRTNHVHVVLSADMSPERVMDDFKAHATRRMVEQGVFPKDTKAWARHGSTRYLWSEADIASACAYVEDGQGVDLPLNEGLPTQPLPHGRGSDQPPPSAQTSAQETESGTPVISGEDAFKLHDTFGFPIDLTQIMAAEKGLSVDVAEYERLMDEARKRARGASTEHDVSFEAIALISGPVPRTDDSLKYATDVLDALLVTVARLSDDGTPTLLDESASLSLAERAGLVFDKTCFYVEQGGQVGDCGSITGPSMRFDVEDTQRFQDAVVHVGTLVQGQIRIGDTLTLRVDPRRAATMQNHTATHILNWALRAVLGEHVQQKGSLVDHEKTRFDFAHTKPLTPQEIVDIERLVNDRIDQKLTVHDQLVPQQEALKINGLRAVFGEKYPDEVRVMSIGVPVDDLLAKPDSEDWRHVSIEFCGGTHVKNTGEIERFVLTSEESVAKGIRRVVGITGQAAREAEERGLKLIERTKQVKEGPVDQVAAGIAELQQALADVVIPVRHRFALRQLIGDLQQAARQQQKAVAADAADVVKQHVGELLEQATKIGDTTVVVGEMPDVPIEQLKNGADSIKQKCGSAAVLFGVRTDKKALLLAAMSPDLIKKGLKAGDLVKAIAPLVKGGGGGPPTMAQAGGKDPTRIPESLAAGRDWITQKLG